ncbi:MAG: alpha/beta fold hydrolase [Ectothiorhodospiraceae bacterium]|nr:alpha/beta fold hydrolase [Ectothiorhodospiraceae bacterium]
MHKLFHTLSIQFSGFITKLISIILKVGAFITPTLSKRLVWHLFSTPFKGPVRKNILREKLFSQAKVLDLSFGSSFVRTYSWSCKGKSCKGKILLVHGWGAYALSMACLINPLRELGYDVISFDQPAHGKSPGRQTDLPKMVDSLDIVITQLGAFNAAISHSFGGIVITNWISKNINRGQFNTIKKLVLISAPKDMMATIKQFSKKLDLTSKHNAHIVERVEAITYQPINDLTITGFLKGRGIMNLLVHDENDTWVPLSDSMQAAERVDNGELFITSKLGHTKLMCSDLVIDKIKIFMSNH